MTSPITCDDCGACCAEVCSPPFVDETHRLPRPVYDDYLLGIGHRETHGFGDIPCFWLTADRKCRHYDHRPDVCREFEVGSEGCLAWRDEALAEQRKAKHD